MKQRESCLQHTHIQTNRQTFSGHSVDMEDAQLPVVCQYGCFQADFLSSQKPVAVSVRVLSDIFSLLSARKRVLTAWLKIVN